MALVVVAFVVLALSVAKFAVVPHRVVMVAEIALNTFANKLVRTFKLVIEEVAATKRLVLKFVEVELVIVPFVTLT